NVVLQDGTPGAYLASFTALAQLPDLWQGMAKALVFGLIPAIVACYKGMNAAGGPKGVGDAVNESVVITFMLLFVVNFVMSAIYFQLVPPKTGYAMASIKAFYEKPLRSLDDLGGELAFFLRALAWTPKTVVRYKKE